MTIMQTRRRFLTTLSLVGAAGFVGAPRALAAKAGLETTTVRIANVPGICIAPQYVAEELLRAEGFTDVRYVRLGARQQRAGGDRSRRNRFRSEFCLRTRRRARSMALSMTVLGGVHVGCFELFVNEGIRSLTDLKGKKVGIAFLGSPGHLFLAAMAAHVGIDPGKDLNWVTSEPAGPMELFTEREGRCLPGLSARPAGAARPAYRTRHRQQRRSTGPGRNISAACWRATGSSSAIIRSPPRPCCAPSSRPPISASPSRRGPHDGSSMAVSPLAMITRCRRSTRSPTTNGANTITEDTLRFYALRLHEAGMIKSSPQKIIADGTDWRFLNELKRELKA